MATNKNKPHDSNQLLSLAFHVFRAVMLILAHIIRSTLTDLYGRRILTDGEAGYNEIEGRRECSAYL